MTVQTRRPGILARLRADKRGVAFVEFALIAPLLIMFYMGCVEFSLALMASKRAAHTSAAVGDLIAQATQLSTADIEDIFRISRTAMTPFDTQPLRVRWTQLRQINATSYEVILPSCHKNWSARTNAAGVPQGVVADNEFIVFAESEYNYDSPVNAFMPGVNTFRSQIVYRPRIANRLTGPGGAAIACPGSGW